MRRFALLLAAAILFAPACQKTTGAGGEWTGDDPYPGQDSSLFPVSTQPIPEYLAYEYVVTRDSVRAHRGEAAFIFASDLHFSFKGSGYAENVTRVPVNSMFSCMYRMIEEAGIPVVCIGGDYMQLPKIDAGQTKDMGFRVLDDLQAWLDGIKCTYYAIAGNHEVNFTGDWTGNGLSFEEFDSYLHPHILQRQPQLKALSSRVVCADDTSGRVRYIFIDTMSEDYSDAIKEDVRTACTTLPENYSVVAINHFACNKAGEIYPGVKQCLDVIKATGVDFVGWIAGHCHGDWALKYEGMNVITCLQSGALTPHQSQDGITYEHLAGTETETAFSVFTIDRESRELHCFRFGLGKDRIMTF